MASGGSICRYYKTNGGCWYGDKCRFIHDGNQNNSARRATQVAGQRCKFFLTSAGCRFGDNCYYRHDNDGTVETLLVQVNADEESTPQFPEKYEQETPEKDTCTIPNESESPESGIVHSPVEGAAGCELGTSSEEEGVEEEEESLLSEDSDRNKKKWENMKSEKEDRAKPEIKEAKCGECGQEFKSDDAFELLREHYLEQMKKFHYSHLKFLNKHYRFDHTTCCMICDKLFGRSRDLLRHIVDKSKQQTEDGEEHHAFLDVGVVLPFCYRDTLDHDDDKLMEELFLALVHTYDGSDTDSEGEDFLNFMSFAHVLTKMPHAHILNMGADDSSDDDDGGMFGFSEEDCFDLACQGIKPWDPEAGAALAVLNGYCTF